MWTAVSSFRWKYEVSAFPVKFTLWNNTHPVTKARYKCGKYKDYCTDASTTSEGLRKTFYSFYLFLCTNLRISNNFNTQRENNSWHSVTQITTPETLRGLQLVQSAHSSLSRMETTAGTALWLTGGCEYIGTTALHYSNTLYLIYFIKHSVMCSCANKQVSPVKMETVENDNPNTHKGKRSSWNSCGLKTTLNPV